jgi:hypothetical protein
LSAYWRRRHQDIAHERAIRQQGPRRAARRGLRDQDLLTLFQAYRLALDEQLDAGKITMTQANLQLAQMQTKITSEAQRRANNAEMAAAATMAATPGPTTCDTYGYSYGGIMAQTP